MRPCAGEGAQIPVGERGQRGKVHARPVDGFQLVVQEVGHAQLLHCACEGELLLPGVAAHGAAQCPLAHGVRQHVEPDVPLCQTLRHVVRRSGKEAYAARWYEHGLRARRYERVGAGEHVQSAWAGVCAHDVQKFFCQAAAVVEQVHTLALRGDRIREENSPLTRDGA